MAISAPYFYGKYDKFDYYALELGRMIEAGNAQSLRLQKQAIEVGSDQARQQAQQLRQVGESLESGLEALRAEFNWGFTVLADRMDTQIEQLTQIAAKLDAIHETLNVPLQTEARELFNLGREYHRKGLYDKAREAYVKAEQKIEVDFPLQFQIGKLLLFGRDENVSVINLPEAEKHFLLAARYAQAEKGTIPQWNEYCGQAYFHAAFAAYLIGEQEQATGHLDSMRACLERALGYLAKAEILIPRFSETFYQQAKCHALLGQTQDALKKFEVLSDWDRRYFAKAMQDGDFKTIRAEVEGVFKRAVTSPGPRARVAQTKLHDTGQALAWAKRSAPTSQEDLAAIESIERELCRASGSLPTLEVDIEGLSERLSQMRAGLEEMARRSFQNNIDACQKAIGSAEWRKSYCEKSTDELRRTMKQTSGAAMGWALGIASVFALAIVFGVVFGVLTVGMSPGASDGLMARVIPPLDVGILIGSIIIGIYASRVARARKNQPHQRQLEENARTIDECVRTLTSLREKVKSWEEQSRSFEAWQAQRSSAPRSPASGLSDA